MRLFVWFLVLLNVGLLVYFNMDTLVPKVEVKRQEINPAKLKLLMDADFENLAKKEITTAVIEKSCYKWGKFSDSNLPVAQEVVSSLGLAYEVVEESSVEQDRRFWVYYPPLQSLELAQSKADEIKRLGVDELYIVQDSKWRNAISFGLFSEEGGADALLKELKAKGVRNVIKSLRNQGTATTSMMIKDVSLKSAVDLYKVRPEFVGTEVRPVPCQ